MSDTPYREASRRDEGTASQRTTRCLYCGAPPTGGATCPWCHADARVHDRPVTNDLPSCPRCRIVYLTRDAIEPGTEPVDVCLECHGLFIPRGAWTELFDRLTKDVVAGVGRFVPLPPGSPRPPLLALVHCPRCGVEMDRAAFAARSRVVIDVCSAHGVWLDAAELASMIAFFRRAGAGEIEEEPNDAPTPAEVSLLEHLRLLDTAFVRPRAKLDDRELADPTFVGSEEPGLVLLHSQIGDVRSQLLAVRLELRRARER